MKVSDLQQHLANLARLLDSSGAKTVAADLAAIGAGLAPFREQPLKGFADFLVRAEAYSRGEVPLVQPTGRRAGGARATTARQPAPDAAALGEEVKRLYDGAADPSVTKEQVEALAGRLAPLKKDDLVGISERIGMAGMGAKTKGKIQEAIRDRILARKGAAQRAGLIDRPAAAEGNSSEVSFSGTTRE